MLWDPPPDKLWLTSEESATASCNRLAWANADGPGSPIADCRAKVREIDAPRWREIEEITEDILEEQIDPLLDEIDSLEATANEEAEE